MCEYMKALIRKMKPLSAVNKNYFIIGKKANNTIFKYMTLGDVISSFLDNSIYFAEPTTWKDNYESRFYTAKYVSNTQPFIAPKLFASCFTKNKVSEAAWAMYKKNTTGIDSFCVKLTIDIDKFRKNLSKAVRSTGNIYEGEINYSLCQTDLNNLHKSSSKKYYKHLFSKFSLEKFLNLLLLKRPFFEYENEIRFFINLNNSPSGNAYIVKNINWKDFVKEITIHSNNSSNEYKVLEQILKDTKITAPLKSKSIYNTTNKKALIITTI